MLTEGQVVSQTCDALDGWILVHEENRLHLLVHQQTHEYRVCTMMPGRQLGYYVSAKEAAAGFNKYLELEASLGFDNLIELYGEP